MKDGGLSPSDYHDYRKVKNVRGDGVYALNKNTCWAVLRLIFNVKMQSLCGVG